MGALDGKQFSVSRDFLPFKWHRILIDATPKWREEAKIHSSDATYISAAICNQDKIMHYLSRPASDNAINGLAELMDPKYLKAFHPKVYHESIKYGTKNLSSVNWELFKTKAKYGMTDTVADIVHCISLNKVLDTVKIKKINLFVLDVEGGELDVLKSIDFSKVQFDVLCVEDEPKFRPKGYRLLVISFLKEYGYQFLTSNGRNSWFKHKSFQPSSKSN